MRIDSNISCFFKTFNKNYNMAHKLFIFTFFVLINCQTALVKKEKILEFNKYLQDKSYILKEDIQVGEGEIFKKGMLVKIWVESTPTLLKIKCFPAQNERENASGKLVAYIVNEEFKKKVFTLEDLENLINQRLKLYTK